MNAMTPQNRTANAFKTIWKATGLTCPQIAERIGKKDPTVKKIASGERRLTLETAKAISIATGADMKRLMEGEACDWQGQPYTSDSFIEHQKRFHEELPAHKDALLRWVELLLDKSEGRNWEYVRVSLVGWLDKTRTKRGLGPAIDAELKRRKPEIVEPHFVNTIRQIAGEKAVKILHEASGKLPEDLDPFDVVNVKVPKEKVADYYQREWAPESGKPPIPSH